MAEDNSVRRSGARDEQVQKWLQNIRDERGNHRAGNWMAAIIPHLSLVKTSPERHPPSVSFTFTVQPEHCNRMHSLHGGCVASILDYTTTLALAVVNRPGFWENMGVSRSLAVTYLRPAPAGTELIIDCEVVQVGKTLATLRGTMRRQRDSQITATCEHGKVNNDPKPAL